MDCFFQYNYQNCELICFNKLKIIDLSNQYFIKEAEQAQEIQAKTQTDSFKEPQDIKVFPEFRENYQYTQGKESLSRLINQDSKCKAQQTLFYISFYRSFLRAYCRFKYCQARIIYQKSFDDKYYKLIGFQNQHSNHFQPKRMPPTNNPLKSLTQSDKIAKFQRDFKDGKYKNMDSLQIKLDAKEKYEFQFAKTQKIIEFMEKTQENFDVLIKNFQKQNTLFWYPQMSIAQKDPSCMVIITQQMKNDYQKFGQYVCFKTVRSMIGSNKKEQIKYQIGLLVGQNCGKQLITFGILINKHNSFDNYLQLILKAMKILQKPPQVLITEFSQDYQILVQNINKQAGCQIHQIFDIQYALQILCQNLKTQSIQYQQYILKIIQQKTQKKYLEYLGKAYKKFSGSDIKILQFITKKSQKLCFTQYPKALIGLNSPNKMGDHLKIKIQNQFRIPKSFYRYTTKLLQFLKEYKNSQGSIKIGFDFSQISGNFAPIKNLNNHLTIQVMRIVAEAFKDARQVDIYQSKQQNKQNFHYKILQAGFLFKVFMKNNKLSCQCSIFQKTGLPCSHLIRVCLLRQEKIQKYIHKRWLVQSIFNSYDKKPVEQIKNKTNISEQKDIDKTTQIKEKQNHKQHLINILKNSLKNRLSNQKKSNQL